VLDDVKALRFATTRCAGALRAALTSSARGASRGSRAMGRRVPPAGAPSSGRRARRKTSGESRSGGVTRIPEQQRKMSAMRLAAPCKPKARRVIVRTLAFLKGPREARVPVGPRDPFRRHPAVPAVDTPDRVLELHREAASIQMAPASFAAIVARSALAAAPAIRRALGRLRADDELRFGEPEPGDARVLQAEQRAQYAGVAHGERGRVGSLDNPQRASLLRAHSIAVCTAPLGSSVSTYRHRVDGHAPSPRPFGGATTSPAHPLMCAETAIYQRERAWQNVTTT
jgi:hypothetical protein